MMFQIDFMVENHPAYLAAKSAAEERYAAFFFSQHTAFGNNFRNK